MLQSRYHRRSFQMPLQSRDFFASPFPSASRTQLGAARCPISVSTLHVRATRKPPTTLNLPGSMRRSEDVEPRRSTRQEKASMFGNEAG
ncbi:hypothetical protein BKA81DRAFT_367353 [Phyllosticta paracitricarpa]